MSVTSRKRFLLTDPVSYRSMLAYCIELNEDFKELFCPKTFWSIGFFSLGTQELPFRGRMWKRAWPKLFIQKQSTPPWLGQRILPFTCHSCLLLALETNCTIYGHWTVTTFSFWISLSKRTRNPETEFRGEELLLDVTYQGKGSASALTINWTIKMATYYKMNTMRQSESDSWAFSPSLYCKEIKVKAEWSCHRQGSLSLPTSRICAAFTAAPRLVLKWV